MASNGPSLAIPGKPFGPQKAVLFVGFADKASPLLHGDRLDAGPNPRFMAESRPPVSISKFEDVLMLKRLVLLLLPASLLAFVLSAQAETFTLEELIAGDHRSEPNIVRNPFRHPVETLEFFGLRPDSTVIEIHPAGGWYSEIIAPYVRDEGRYYAAHFSPNSMRASQQRQPGRLRGQDGCQFRFVRPGYYSPSPSPA